MKWLTVLHTLIVVSNLAAGTTQPILVSQFAEKNGLQIRLITEKTVFARNDPIKFTIRFKNISDKPLSLQDADDVGQWIIRLQHVNSKMPWRLQRMSVGQPETPREPRELKPGESLDVSTDWGSNRFPFRYESELVLNMPMPPADSLYPGRYQLWVGINLKRNLEREGAQLAFRGDMNVGPVEIEISDKDDPKGIQTSQAVKENNAEFQTVARPQWFIPAVGAKSEVQMGLKVTNRSGRWMQINVFDTLEVVSTDSQGRELRCLNVRDATFIPDPMVLEVRESRMIYRNATLEWSEDGKNLLLGGSDGAGGNWHLDSLKPGKYTVHFVYENNGNLLKSVLDRPARHVTDPKEAPFWLGKVTTSDVAVELVDATREK